MKKNDLADNKKIDYKSILVKVEKIRSEIEGLIVDKNMKKLKNLRVIKNKRKDLAQLLTIIRQKQLIEQLEETNGKTK